MERVHPLTQFRNKQSPPLSQAELAKLLEVSRSYIHRVEAGGRKIGREILPRVSEKTGISPADLRPDLADLFKEPEAAQ